MHVLFRFNVFNNVFNALSAGQDLDLHLYKFTQPTELEKNSKF